MICGAPPRFGHMGTQHIIGTVTSADLCTSAGCVVETSLCLHMSLTRPTHQYPMCQRLVGLWSWMWTTNRYSLNCVRGHASLKLGWVDGQCRADSRLFTVAHQVAFQRGVLVCDVKPVKLPHEAPLRHAGHQLPVRNWKCSSMSLSCVFASPVKGSMGGRRIMWKRRCSSAPFHRPDRVSSGWKSPFVIDWITACKRMSGPAKGSPLYSRTMRSPGKASPVFQGCSSFRHPRHRRRFATLACEFCYENNVVLKFPQ